MKEIRKEIEKRQKMKQDGKIKKVTCKSGNIERKIVGYYSKKKICSKIVLGQICTQIDDCV